MILSDEEAKATQEVAKATGKAIDIVSGAGTVLVNGTVGKITAATLGLLGGNWVLEQEERNLARLKAKTARILDGIAKDRLSDPSPSVVKPLLAAAADESRGELQDLWAALLANAMVDGGRRVRRDYFEAVRQMEPTDVLYLDIAGQHFSATDGKLDIDAVHLEATHRGFSAIEQAISVSRLHQLRCLEQDRWYLLPFGRGLLGACRVV